VIILIHGGGWNQGDKADFTPYVDTLKKRMPVMQFSISITGLRQAQPTFSHQENDVKAAIDLIYSKRTEYKISDKFVLLGASAGGHLSLLHAYKNSTPVKIKAVVDFFGPTELVDMYNNPPNPLVPIIAPAGNWWYTATFPVIYQQSSPINYVTAQSPRQLFFMAGWMLLFLFRNQ
jgi:acetyl esterase/lipase